ncbi:MAG: dihydropteroate synthase [Anaerolineales bacterium]
MKSDQLTLRDHVFQWGTRTYVMGIINVTPDSFSGDGLLEAGAGKKQLQEDRQWLAAAIEQSQEFLNAGVDILDVGGESTRPGALPVGEEEELARVIPVIRILREQVDAVISIDTYRATVAQAAIDAGADLVNDVWGLHADPKIAQVVARNRVPVILMHNRSSWVHAEIKERLGGRYVGMPYNNLLEDICNELLESVTLAHAAGVADECILLDPGIGFGKTVEQNLELIDRLGEIRDLGYPLLVGPSRKSFIGYTHDLPPDQRLEGTAAAVAISIARGADLVRVHDVASIARVVKMTDAIVRRQA